MKYFTANFKKGDCISGTDLLSALRPGFPRKLNITEAFAVMEVECRALGDIQPIWDSTYGTSVEFIAPFKKFLRKEGHYKAPISKRAMENIWLSAKIKSKRKDRK